MDEGSAELTVGQRIQDLRKRAGMTRPVLAGLVGRSTEWVKSVEAGRLLTPRLAMLIQLAEALGVDDLAELTGDPRISTGSWSKAGHDALPRVSAALTDYTINPNAGPVAATTLAAQVRQAWTLWHGSRAQRTAISVVLPDLITTARTAVRRLDGDDRRASAAALAQIYHLTQLFLSFQPVPELVLLTGDRAMTAAQDADDPQALAAAAWYLNHVFRDAGQAAEARIALATRTAALLHPEDGSEDLALTGLLQLAVALSHAKTGRAGDAWRHFDEADRIARALPTGYTHPWLMFGRGMVDAYAITVHTDLMRPRDAVAVANRLDLTGMPSATRRSFHLTEIARAYHQQREPVATVHLLQQAYAASPDTTRFSPFTRAALGELRRTGGATIQRDAATLGAAIGLPAA